MFFMHLSLKDHFSFFNNYKSKFSEYMTRLIMPFVLSFDCILGQYFILELFFTCVD